MKIELPAALEKMVREKVDAGLYDDELAVISDALAQMQDRDKTERAKAKWLIEAVDQGLQDVAEGRYEVVETDEELKAFFEKL